MDKFKMNSGCLDDREEGEIIEDEFEDVSDCSMSISSIASPLPPGKLLAPPEFLPAVCLSSVSDDDDDINERRIVPVYTKNSTKRKRHSRSPHCNHRRKRQTKTHSRRTKNYVNYDSASENERLEKRILLNKALRRESQEESLHNSLRTRLKSMFYNNMEQPSSDDEDLETLRNIALSSRNSKATDKLIPKTETSLERDIKDDLNSVIEKDLNSNCDSVIVIDETEDSENNSEIRDNSEIAENNNDNELINLRLEALKSAVIKKCRERKKKKILLEKESKIVNNYEDIIIPADVVEFDEIDKENSYTTKEDSCNLTKTKKNNIESEKVLNESNPTVNCQVKDSCTSPKPIAKAESERSELLTKKEEKGGEIKSATNEIKKNTSEEDADILRAMLLTSISQKISNSNASTTTTKTQNSQNNIHYSKVLINKGVQPFNQKHLHTSVTHKTVINKTDVSNKSTISGVFNSKSHKWAKIPGNIKVKPLIINLNDSDSEDDSSENVTKVGELKNTVEKFLKKQRAEIEAKEMNNVAKIAEKTKIQTNYKNVATLKKPLNNKSINELLLDKSAVKLLPKSQQIEYQRLKQQLLNPKRINRAKKTIKPQSSTQKKLILQTENVKKVSLPSNLNYNNKLIVKTNVAGVKQTPVSEEETALGALTNLKKILDEVQVQQNGRLQMKGRYQTLVPLLRQINQASYEKSQNEDKIKKLLSQLQEARAKLGDTHKKFVNLVQHLVTTKESLDKGPFNNKLPKEFTTQVCTSTPIKPNVILSCNVSNVTKESTEKELTKKVDDDNKFQVEIAKDTHNRNSNVKNGGEKDLGGDNNKYLNGMELFDPNDVEKVFVEQEKPFLDYVSPLGGNNSDNNKVTDPLKELCPYDLFGVCRDKECPYKHLS